MRLIPQILIALVCLFTAVSDIARGDSISAQRIGELPAAQQQPWLDYCARSQAKARADADTLQRELAANGMKIAIQAPSGGDFKLSAATEDAWYARPEAAELAGVIISYQTPSGGWSKHTGYSSGRRKFGMQWTSQNQPGASPHYVATFDNRSTTEQIRFLSNVWLATQREDCKTAVMKGLEFIYSAQFPCGGWPQVYPLEGGYHDNITFNDDVMVHVLEILRDVAANEPEYAFLNDAQRRQATDSLEAGIACILKTQISVNGKKTVWCAQHDALTLLPAGARKLEPPTLSGIESAHILRFLMTIQKPSPELVESIESGLSWLEAAAVTGIAKTKVDGRTIYVVDPTAKEVYWARFYDLKTGKPTFPGRDGIVYDSFEAMAKENKLGYDFYSTLPASVLKTSQKKWRSKRYSTRW